MPRQGQITQATKRSRGNTDYEIGIKIKNYSPIYVQSINVS